MVPEEDRGPTWLRDYGFTDFGDIAADINAMAEYAAKLAADVEANYAPHEDGVTATMMTRLPEVPAGFAELKSFNDVHSAALDVVQVNLKSFGQGSTVLAHAAQKISEDYRSSDAFAHATVRDVDATMAPGTFPHSPEGDA